MNKKFENACNRKSQKVPPIWFMRQAGRYHSHYRDLKKVNTFELLCKTPELAAEVALGPIKEFDYDVINREWNHKGFSSQGDTLHEIWVKRR